MPIIDDGGDLSKTVSVEDSFIRGSVLSFASTVAKLQLLYGRLLRLLVQRRDIAAKPHLSYPKAMRVSVRIVDRSLEKLGRRPFRTISKQSYFNGKQLMEQTDALEQESTLKTSALLLLNSLLKGSSILDLNVTRLNIAVIAFADIDSSLSSRETKSLSVETSSSQQKSLSTYFAQNNNQTLRSTTERNLSPVATKKKRQCFPSSQKEPSLKRLKQQSGNEFQANLNEKLKVPPGIDPSALASLPSDIVDEVLKNPSLQHATFKENKKEKMGIITSYFKKK